MNRSKTKNQSRMDPKQGEGNKEARIIHLEGSPETSKTKETIEARDDSNEIEEKSSNGDSKESEAVLSDHQVKDQDEGATVIKEG